MAGACVAKMVAWESEKPSRPLNIELKSAGAFSWRHELIR